LSFVSLERQTVPSSSFTSSHSLFNTGKVRTGEWGSMPSRPVFAGSDAGHASAVGCFHAPVRIPFVSGRKSSGRDNYLSWPHGSLLRDTGASIHGSSFGRINAFFSHRNSAALVLLLMGPAHRSTATGFAGGMVLVVQRIFSQSNTNFIPNRQSFYQHGSLIIYR
jgi:hypothetical protein